MQQMMWSVSDDSQGPVQWDQSFRGSNSESNVPEENQGPPMTIC